MDRLDGKSGSCFNLLKNALFEVFVVTKKLHCSDVLFNEREKERGKNLNYIQYVYKPCCKILALPTQGCREILLKVVKSLKKNQ